MEGSAPQPPPKRASKTSAYAQERPKERRQAAKSVKIDISDEDWQEVGDWLLRRRQETSGKNQYVPAAEYFLKRWELLPLGANVEAYIRKCADMAESRLRYFLPAAVYHSTCTSGCGCSVSLFFSCARRILHMLWCRIREKAIVKGPTGAELGTYENH